MTEHARIETGLKVQTQVGHAKLQSLIRNKLQVVAREMLQHLGPVYVMVVIHERLIQVVLVLDKQVMQCQAGSAR